jgi:acetyl esterase
MRTDVSMTAMPQNLQDRMAEIGPRWQADIRKASDEVKAAYAPLLAAAPKSDITVSRDIAYGTHARQVLDVYVPERADGAPVVVFVHGGAFVRGDKSSAAGIYDNVLYWFARQGFVGVNLEYRLAPEAVFPSAVDDVAAGMQWVHDNVKHYGGDPERVLLIGHSAGGTHVASYAFDPLLGYAGKYADALVLISARLTADVLPENPNAAHVQTYFGDDHTAYEARSPMAHAAHGDLPVFIVTAEFDNPLLDLYGLEFAYKLAVARRRAPRFLSMRRHNHMSIVAHFNTAEELLGHEIIDFFDQEAPRPQAAA